MKTIITLSLAITGLVACSPSGDKKSEAVAEMPKSENAPAEMIAALEKKSSRFAVKFSKEYARLEALKPDIPDDLWRRKQGLCVGEILHKEISPNEAQRIYMIYKISKTNADFDKNLKPIWSPTPEYAKSVGTDIVMQNLKIMMSLPDAIKHCEKLDPKKLHW